MNEKDLDKVNEALEIINGVRDNIIFLENSSIKQIPNTVCVVFEVALDKVIFLLNEVSVSMESKSV